MQENRSLTIAALLVAALVILVLVLGRQQSVDNGPTENGAWLPEIKAQLADVQKIMLRSTSDSVTLIKADGNWQVQERFDYRADIVQLQDLFDALANARLLEQKTARPEYLDRLGLSDIEHPDSEAVLIEAWGTQPEPLFRVLIGKVAEGRSGTYVRSATENQSWLVSTSPQAPAEPGDWLDKKLLDADFDRVSSVARQVRGADAFVARRDKESASSLQVANIPVGFKPKYSTVFDAAARAILTASMEDVKPVSEHEFAMPGTAHTLISLFNGVRIDVAANKGEDGKWVKFEFSRDETLAGSEKPAGDGAAVAQPGAEAQVQALHARLDGWAFKVSDYVFGELDKPLPEYLDKEQTEGAARSE